MLPAVARCISYVPMPTVSQVALGQTIALACWTLFKNAQRIPWMDSQIPWHVSRTVWRISFVALSNIGLVTLLAAAQKRFPLLSLTGIVLLLPFILKDLTSICRKAKFSDSKRDLALFGIFTNLVTTSILFYQNRSLLNGLHFAANPAIIALNFFLQPAKPSNRFP